MWLFEGTNIIEYHYGPSMINDPDTFYWGPGAYIGLLTFNETLDSIFNIHFLSGPAASPTLTSSDVTVTGTPPNGTIYRFSPVTLDIPSYSAEFSQNILYPNPAHDFIEIQNLGNENLDVTVFDLSGKLVFRYSASEKDIKIDISQLSPGMYIIGLKGKSENTYKLMKF